MVVIQLTGGIGNQLFQYSTAKALSKFNNQDLYLDINSFRWDNLRNYALGNFKINAKIASPEIIENIKNGTISLADKLLFYFKNKEIPYFPIIIEQKFSFDLNFSKFRNTNVYLQGYWQSELYFKKFRDELIQEIRNFDYFIGLSKDFLQQIISTQGAVSLHVRRGDYVANKETNEYHGTCSNDYYKNAIQIIESYVKTPHFFIFSDDKEYVKHLFSDSSSFTIVEGINQDFEELLLMSACEHHIIANSSFSWWGAWLNPNSEKKVIVPKVWFLNVEMQNQVGDLIPTNWIKI